MVTYPNNEKILAELLTSVAFHDEVLAEAITRAAVEIDLKRQADCALIGMIHNS